MHKFNMRKYTAQDGLDLLKMGNIQLPENEKPEFEEQFNKLFGPKTRYNSFAAAVEDIYCNILPFRDKKYEGNEFSEMARRYKTFKINVIRSGLAKGYEEQLVA